MGGLRVVNIVEEWGGYCETLLCGVNASRLTRFPVFSTPDFFSWDLKLLTKHETSW